MAIEKDFDHNNENCIEWLSGERTTTVTFTDRKMINRVKNYTRIEKTNLNT